MPLALLPLLLTAIISAAAVGFWLAWRAGRLAKRGVSAARRLPVVRHVPLLGAAPSSPDPNADLVAYPERLLQLESRLVERHAAVQEQLRVLTARRAELDPKPDRADLVARYDTDILHLDRRATKMRRVITLVWRTRSILLLRVFLAVTGRRRPALGNLPSPRADTRLSRPHLRAARTLYAEAAAEVRGFVAEIAARATQLGDVVPPPPLAAEPDGDETSAVSAELARTERAHAELAARMDRLADNLTWLSDHAGTLGVVDEDVAAPVGGPGADTAAHLLAEVESAVNQLNQLAGSVDHQLAGRALDELDVDVGRLETAGLEEEAAAAAELEVARLVEGFPT